MWKMFIKMSSNLFKYFVSNFISFLCVFFFNKKPQKLIKIHFLKPLFKRYFLDDEELDFNDILAFGTSLILLTNSINNIVITSQIGKVGGNTLRNLLQTKIK